MTLPGSNEPKELKEARIPRRDWILLPLIGLLTICLLAGATELIATLRFPRYKGHVEDCLVLDQPARGARGIPNCRCWGGVVEGSRVEYKFNRCGDRSELDCDTKEPGTYRIVAIGASQAFGYGVASEETFDDLLPLEISQRLGRKVELYNDAMARYGTSHAVSLRFKETLATHPDLILWMLSTHDVASEPITADGAKGASGAVSMAAVSGKTGGSHAGIWEQIKAEFVGRSIPDAVRELSGRTRTVPFLENLLYRDRKRYVRNFMMGGVDAQLLKSQFSAESEKKVEQFDRDTADIEAQSAAAGVPFVAVLLPNRAQAVMISMGEWPAGSDPYKLGERLRSIVTRGGGIFIDLQPYYRSIPNPERGYFSVDGHLNSEGNAMVARMMATEMTSGVIPALKAAGQAQPAFEKGK